MKAHAKLWIDDKGRLCDAPPSGGIKIAAFVGDEIPKHIAEQYKLEVSGGRVVQAGKEAKTPKSTPDALIADRTLYIAHNGNLVDSAPADGIKIADEGDVVQTYYVNEYGLEIRDGRIEQKHPKAVGGVPDKAVKKPVNKGLTVEKEGD